MIRYPIGYAIAIALAAAPAAAHTGVEAHGHDGFAAGFLHPLVGLDHLLAMIAVGLWAALIGGRAILVLCLAFPAAMAAGAVFGMSGVSVPGVEAGIATSVLALGVAIVLALKPPMPVAAGLTAVFALAHGFAHGAELPAGADALGYGLGFVLATAALHVVGAGLGWLAVRDTRRDAGRGALTALRGAGACIAAAGLVFLAT